MTDPDEAWREPIFLPPAIPDLPDNDEPEDHQQ